MATFGKAKLTEYVTEDGEIQLGYETTKISKYKEKEFDKMFLEDILDIKKLNNIADVKILIWLTKYMMYGTNKVALVKEIKERLCEDMDVSISNLNKNLRRLEKENFIIYKNQMAFVNPAYFFRGNEKDLSKVMAEYNTLLNTK